MTTLFEQCLSSLPAITAYTRGGFSGMIFKLQVLVSIRLKTSERIRLVAVSWSAIRSAVTSPSKKAATNRADFDRFLFTGISQTLLLAQSDLGCNWLVRAFLRMILNSELPFPSSADFGQC